MSFGEWREEQRIKRETKKLKKEADREDRRLDAVANANQTRSEIAERREEQRGRSADEDWVSQKLSDDKFNAEVQQVRDKLFVQESKLLKRCCLALGEYRYLKTQKETSGKKKRLEVLKKDAKNSFYAIAIVEQAIERLDDMASAYEWQQIMKELSSAYKMMNAISVGSGLMTRFAFWVKRAKSEIQGEVSIKSMEQHFGMPIDELVSKDITDQLVFDNDGTEAADALVDNAFLDEISLDSQKILQAIRDEEYLFISPMEMTKAAEDYNEVAETQGRQPMYTKTEEPLGDIDDMLSGSGMT